MIPDAKAEAEKQEKGKRKVETTALELEGGVVAARVALKAEQVRRARGEALGSTNLTTHLQARIEKMPEGPKKREAEKKLQRRKKAVDAAEKQACRYVAQYCPRTSFQPQPRSQS